MYWKETGGVEKLFSLPSRSIPARSLVNNYNRQLFSHSTILEDFTCVAPLEILALEYSAQENETSLIIFNKKGRKRKNDFTTHLISDHVADTLVQSWEAPEAVREHQKSLGISVLSLDIATKDHESISCQNDTNIFDNIRSPELLPFNDMEQFSSINEIPLTPRNSNHDIDDFNQGDSTPAGLDHGQVTPQHTSFGELDNIPHPPSDQINSILKDSLDRPIMVENLFVEKNTNISSKDWHNYDVSNPVVQVRNS